MSQRPLSDSEALRARLTQERANLPDDRPRGQRWAITPRTLVIATLILLTVASLIGARLITRVPGQVIPLSSLEMPKGATGSGEEEPGGQGRDSDPAGPIAGTGEQHQLAEPGSQTVVVQESVLLVHVVGQVQHPGIVELAPGARVVDAVHEAGGATSEANLAAINLARAVSDGEQIVIPAEGETVAPQTGGLAQTADTGQPGTVGTDGLVDINLADAAAFETLPGIGPVLAQRIVEHRSANGPFTSVDQLRAVSGIGPAIMARIEDRVRL